MTAIEAAVWGAVASIPLVIGALLAFRFRPSQRVVGLIMGFGAGALVSAVAYELFPESETADLFIVGALVLGALTFYSVDSLIDRRNAKEGGRAKTGAGISIALGALLDGIPESIVLGMSVAVGGSVSLAFLAAVFASNLPESLGATSSLQESGLPRKRIMHIWVGIVLLSTALAALGYLLIVSVPQLDGAYAEAFAAGAVLTMLANSMIPEAFREGGRVIGLSLVFGFIVAAALSFAS